MFYKVRFPLIFCFVFIMFVKLELCITGVSRSCIDMSEVWTFNSTIDTFDNQLQHYKIYFLNFNYHFITRKSRIQNIEIVLCDEFSTICIHAVSTFIYTVLLLHVVYCSISIRDWHCRQLSTAGFVILLACRQ